MTSTAKTAAAPMGEQTPLLPPLSIEPTSRHRNSSAVDLDVEDPDSFSFFTPLHMLGGLMLLAAVVSALLLTFPLHHPLPVPDKPDSDEQQPNALLAKCLQFPDRSKVQLSTSVAAFLNADAQLNWQLTSEEEGCYKVRSAYRGAWRLQASSQQLHLMEDTDETHSDYFAFLPVDPLQGSARKEDHFETTRDETRRLLARQHRRFFVSSSSEVRVLRCPAPRDTTYSALALTHTKEAWSLTFSNTKEHSNSAAMWQMDTISFLAGVNLGGYFIPEVWMNPSFFRDTGLGWAGSLCTMHANNSALTEQRMLQGLQGSLSLKDVQLMAELGFRSVRVPLGYWNVLVDPYHRYSPASLTSSQKYLHQLMEWCATYNISVLMDLHGLPGSQNGIDHSGCSVFPQWLAKPGASLLSSSAHSKEEHVDNVVLSLQAVEAIMQDYSRYANFLGIELANEPSLLYYENVTWSAAEQRVNRTGRYFDQMLAYYEAAYDLVRQYHPSCFVYINELYPQYFDIWTELLSSKQRRPTPTKTASSKKTSTHKQRHRRRLSSTSLPNSNIPDNKPEVENSKDLRYRNVIIDFHLYNWQLPYTFESAAQHIADAQQWQGLIETFMSHYPVVIGEWCMSTGTHMQVGQAFVDKSLHSFQSAFASYLWTWKLERNLGFDTWDVQYQAQKFLQARQEKKGEMALNPFPAFQK